jgi:hypothetical protein
MSSRVARDFIVYGPRRRGVVAYGPAGPRRRRSTPTHKAGKRTERFLAASSFRAIRDPGISIGGACRDGCRRDRPYSRRERTSTSGVSFPGARSRRPRAGRPTGDSHGGRAGRLRLRSGQESRTLHPSSHLALTNVFAGGWRREGGGRASPPAAQAPFRHTRSWRRGRRGPPRADFARWGGRGWGDPPPGPGPRQRQSGRIRRGSG